MAGLNRWVHPLVSRNEVHPRQHYVVGQRIGENRRLHIEPFCNIGTWEFTEGFFEDDNTERCEQCLEALARVEAKKN